MINVRIGVKLLIGFIAVSFVSLCIGLYNMHNMQTLANDTAGNWAHILSLQYEFKFIAF